MGSLVLSFYCMDELYVIIASKDVEACLLLTGRNLIAEGYLAASYCF